ncbi:MAG: FAD-dependent oxidoreductase, partial [Salinimicrobium sp.]
MKKIKVAIIGGGLAGLTAAIYLAQKGQKVGLFEKEAFPRHKVCGEYLSREVLPLFDELAIPIEKLAPKNLSRLQFSTLKGKLLEVALPLGGFGISRYALDDLLYREALKHGVKVHQEKVISVNFSENAFKISTSKAEYAASFVLGAYGKRSSLDRSLDRKFFQKPA